MQGWTNCIIAQDDCNDGTSELGCSDFQLGGTPEVLTLDVTINVPVYVFVSAYNAADEQGAYTIDAVLQ